LSKLSKLKQEAYQAGKKRDWDLAVSIYEQILEIDKNNPMVINEMGDLCLKAEETPRAVRHFLGAASRYRSTGLLNNAVAIYKKILRHDAENQNAHWYLAETRASQGLLVEGQEHAVKFLDGNENVSGDIKEIFLKRCGQLFELYASSPTVLEKLLPIYRTWDLHLEASRVRSLLACFSYEEGETDLAREAMQDIAAKTPEVQNYPEYQRLRSLLDPGAVHQARQKADVNALSLDDPAPQPAPDAGAPPAPIEPAVTRIESESPDALIDSDPFGNSTANRSGAAAEAGPTVEIPVDAADDEISFASVASGIQDEDEAVADVSDETVVEIDDDDCFELSLDGEGSSFEDLVAQAASGLGSETADECAEPEVELSLDTDFDSGSGSGKSADDPLGIPVVDETVAEPAARPVDLLAEILSEGSGEKKDHDGSQLAAITSDIGAQVGGGDQDAASLYEMGLVYLDMGLFDQAVESFEKAASEEEYAARALEMIGITLLKAHRAPEAVAALRRGQDHTVPGSREHMGMLYHLAQAHEQSDQDHEALDLYRQICDSDPGFLDVKDRVAQLSNA